MQALDQKGQAPSLLLVDDSPETLQIASFALKKSGFSVEMATSGEEALEKIQKLGLPHMAIVDINMPPGMDGFEFCSRLLRFSEVPVIMLTVVDEEETVVEALNQYAEDYILKPFNPYEVAARVQRVLQRYGVFPYEMAVPVTVDEQLSVNFPARTAIIDEKEIGLTAAETRLLYMLMHHTGQVIELDYLLRRMWPRQMVFENRLYVLVHRLRKKLEEHGDNHQYIVSEPGVGYRFEPLERMTHAFSVAEQPSLLPAVEGV